MGIVRNLAIGGAGAAGAIGLGYLLMPKDSRPQEPVAIAIDRQIQPEVAAQEAARLDNRIASLQERLAISLSQRDAMASIARSGPPQQLY